MPDIYISPPAGEWETVAEIIAPTPPVPPNEGDPDEGDSVWGPGAGCPCPSCVGTRIANEAERRTPAEREADDARFTLEFEARVAANLEATRIAEAEYEARLAANIEAARIREAEYEARRIERQAEYMRERAAEMAAEEEERRLNPDEELPLAGRAHRFCRCESCKLRFFGESKLGHAMVESHNSEPDGGWTPYSLPGEVNPYYLGVELETDAQQGLGWDTPESERPLAYDLAGDMARPKYLWWPKADSSVTGPEFASHPATLDFWQSRRRQLSEMFRMLIHAGYRSHDGGAAGMHVNISRHAFDGGEHLFRFLTLLHADPRWALAMSQRTSHTANQWAKLSTYAPEERRIELCQAVYPYSVFATDTVYNNDNDDNGDDEYDDDGGYYDGDGGYNSDRYVALNVPDDERFEFRLPRGTLRVDRFYKNLEWTAGMIEYTRSRRNRDSTPELFMRWALRTTDIKVPHLAAFIQEKELLA